MDARTLETLKSQWRQFVAERIGDAINDLKTHVPEFSPKYDALILLESRLNDANLKNIQNIISDEALQVQYNQIRADLLLFISALEVQDFEQPASASQGKSGALLYKIPKEMQLAMETKCLVRLAFDKPTIIKNIELTEEVEIRDVRVTEVMQVELIDPSIEQPFHIRSFSDEEQFVEKEAYTEWIFYVKPMKAGTFPLMLKVSVVEKVQGKDRVRNIVWEEQVQITATEPEQAEAAFKDSGLVVGGTEAADLTMLDKFNPNSDTGGSPPPTPETATPEPPPRQVAPTEPASPKPPKKSLGRRLATPIAGALLIASVGAVMLYQFANTGEEITEGGEVYPYPEANIEQMVKEKVSPDALRDSADLAEEVIVDDLNKNVERMEPVLGDSLLDLDKLYVRLLQFKQDSMQLLNTEDSLRLERLIRDVEARKKTQ
jgi:hypothetical protein